MKNLTAAQQAIAIEMIVLALIAGYFDRTNDRFVRDTCESFLVENGYTETQATLNCIEFGLNA